jgi:hypothetical protein
MNKADEGKAGPQAPNRAAIRDDSSAERNHDRGLRGIAWAQIARHARLSKLSVKERRRALAQWLRGIQP